MKSKDFKNLSLNQLKGNWRSVILSLFSAYLVMTAIAMVAELPSTISNIYHTISRYEFYAAIPLYMLSFAGSVILVILSSGFSYGISKYLLHFVRYNESEIGYVFSGFSGGVNTCMRAFVLEILISIFTFLWSLLFVIPGIIAFYRYRMAYFILADDNKISPIDALRISKKMMIGHKWQLFVLQFSFIGWLLLCVITLGIGYIFLAPYMETAIANFYEYLRGIYESNRNTIN